VRKLVRDGVQPVARVGAKLAPREADLVGLGPGARAHAVGLVRGRLVGAHANVAE